MAAKRKRSMSAMTDQQRLLMQLACDTGGMYGEPVLFDAPNSVELRVWFNEVRPQFVPDYAPDELGMPLRPGDIVRCKTAAVRGMFPWAVAFYEGTSDASGAFGSDVYLLREIGGDRRCNMSNEMLEVLRFHDPNDYLEGWRNRCRRWVGMAFTSRYNHEIEDGGWSRRLGPLWVGPDRMVWYSRQHFAVVGGGAMRRFEMPISKATRLKHIVECMNDNGFLDDFDESFEMPHEDVALMPRRWTEEELQSHIARTARLRGLAMPRRS